MKRLLLLMAACLALSTPSPAMAVNQLQAYYAPADLGISGALLSGNPAFSLKVDAFQAVTLYAVLTRAAATTMTFTCTAGPTAGILAPTAVSAPSGSTGIISMTDGSFTWTGVSTSRNFRAVITPLNDAYLTCILSGLNATSDTVSAHLRGVGAR